MNDIHGLVVIVVFANVVDMFSTLTVYAALPQESETNLGSGQYRER